MSLVLAPSDAAEGTTNMTGWPRQEVVAYSDDCLYYEVYDQGPLKPFELCPPPWPGTGESPGTAPAEGAGGGTGYTGGGIVYK